MNNTDQTSATMNLNSAERPLRIEYRTAGFALPVDDNIHPIGSAFRIWTEDISQTGALVISEREITEQRLVLKFALPGTAPHFVVCEVVRDTTYEQELIRGSRTVYSYGVQFMVIIREEAADDALRAAFQNRSATNSQPKKSEPEVRVLKSLPELTERESLVPLLSALGLVVVYLSQM